MKCNGVDGKEWNRMEWNGVELRRKGKIKSVCSVDSKGKFCSMNDKFLCMLGYNVK